MAAEAPGPGWVPPGRQLCLLSLDGGGVRGLSTLHVLKHLMENIAPGAKDIPKPCEYFDMIGGNSTGGILAIMLGRLNMSVEECIKAYEQLCPKVFAKRWGGSAVGKLKLLGRVEGRFDHIALEKAVKDILRDRLVGRSKAEQEEIANSLLKTESDSCHV